MPEAKVSKIVLNSYGSYLGVEKGCLTIRSRSGNVYKYPLFEKEIGEVILQTGNMVSTGALACMGFWGIDCLVRARILKTMKWFRLRGFIILKSSKNNYHVLFDRIVSWKENVQVMAWACLLTKQKKLTGWFILQCRKKGSTLRIGPKGKKSSPRSLSLWKTRQRNTEFPSLEKTDKAIH